MSEIESSTCVVRIGIGIGKFMVKSVISCPTISIFLKATRPGKNENILETFYTNTAFDVKCSKSGFWFPRDWKNCSLIRAIILIKCFADWCKEPHIHVKNKFLIIVGNKYLSKIAIKLFSKFLTKKKIIEDLASLNWSLIPVQITFGKTAELFSMTVMVWNFYVKNNDGLQ